MIVGLFERVDDPMKFIMDIKVVDEGKIRRCIRNVGEKLFNYMCKQ